VLSEPGEHDTGQPYAEARRHSTVEDGHDPAPRHRSAPRTHRRLAATSRSYRHWPSAQRVWHQGRDGLGPAAGSRHQLLLFMACLLTNEDDDPVNGTYRSLDIDVFSGSLHATDAL
jgi:hypothetical protein